MTGASVGFQCPSCISEGRKSVRQARTPYGGAIVANPSLTSIVLIVLNVLVFLGVLATGGATGSLFSHLALLPESTTFRFPDGSVHALEGVSGGAWWQLVTSIFTHAEIWHIGFNMLALWFLGPQLERVLGRARFLAVYFVAGLAGSAAVMLLSEPHTQTMGASGAIFGIMGALLLVGVRVGANMSQLWMWLGLNVVLTFTAGGISWQGHLGGLAGGALAAAVIVYAPRARRTPIQVVGLLVIALVALAVAVVRAAAL